MVRSNTTVARLSKLAESTKVSEANTQSSFFGRRVRSHSVMKSKHPLLLRTSTMDMVASRNSTMLAHCTR